MAQTTEEENPVEGLPDILKTGLKVVFCGINPGMRSAKIGHHFANRSNRFWRVLHRSGFTPEEILPPDAGSLLDYGCGLTSAVEKATVSASELKRLDFINGRASLERKMRRYRPKYLAFLGKPAYSAIFNQREISWGRQSTQLGGTPVWVLPNPSGLNRAFTLTALVAAYQELREALDENRMGSTSGFRIDG
jgi:TDG/mug DNA glycosylase family protein